MDGLRGCRQSQLPTKLDGVIELDTEVAQSFEDENISRVCYEKCPFGTMHHAHVQGGRHRIGCPRHFKSTQEFLNTLSVVVENSDDFNSSNNLRFLRSENINYLALVLGLNEEEIEDSGILKRFHFDQKNPEYLEAAEKATRYLMTNITESTRNVDDFVDVLERFGYLSSYGRVRKLMRSGIENRIFTIPQCISNPLNKMFPPIEPIKKYYPWNCFTPIGKVISEVHKYTRQSLDVNNSIKLRLDCALHTLYVMERSWVWFNGNHSRCMNYFNVLLEKIGLEPIPHGVIDFAAHLFDFEGFERYMHYVIDLEH